MEEFFKAETSENNNNGPSLEDELNKGYADNFINTYELISGDPNEPGCKRFCVEPLWKNPQLMQQYDSEKGTREALRRF